MLYGMTRDEFWNGDPAIAVTYRKLDDLRRHRRNAEDWRLGIYVMHGVQTAIVNALAKKGSSKAKYLEEPLPLTEKEAEEQVIKRELAKEQQMKDWLFAHSKIKKK